MYLVIAALFVAVLSLVVAFVNAIGADHLQKRQILKGVIIAIGLIAISFSLGWWMRPIGPENAIVNARPSSQSGSPPNSPAPSTAPANPSNGTTHKHPTPEYIKKTVEEAPPLARAKVAEQFVGVPVSWNGTLGSSDTERGETTVYLKAGSDIFVVPIQLPKHAFLLQLKEGSALHVDGTIEKVNSWGIPSLRDVTITELSE